MTRRKYYKLINDFMNMKDQDEEIIKTYPKVFNTICKYNFKLSQRVIKSLFDGLSYGNWERLHETEAEMTMTIPELCNSLRWEVFYCSDRMSWDRLCRIHWIWQRIRDRMWRDEMKKEDM